jgi:putative transposase
MDEPHLLAATRYIALNPVRSKLCTRPKDYPWSSATFHVKSKPDPLVGQSPLVDMVTDWKEFLADEPSASTITALKQAERTGRPLGDDRFLDKLTQILGRDLTKKKPGPKPG